MTTIFEPPPTPGSGFDNPPSGSVTISGTARQGFTLSAAHSLFDADGIPSTGPGAIGYQWKADGIAIIGAIASSLILAEAQVGKLITVTAHYIDNKGHADSLSSAPTAAVVKVNDVPTGLVYISGAATPGQQLSAFNTLADADGIPASGNGSITYQWKADGNAIANATANVFTMTDAQIGKTITVTASYVDRHGTPEAVTGGLGKPVALLAYSWKAHTLLGGVDVSGAGYDGATDASGANSFVSAIDSAVSLVANRAVPAAEATATANAVNLQDAIAILKMIVGLDVNEAGRPLSPYQALAADFDGNGSVGLTDALGVLKHLVGLPAPEPAWHFANEADPAMPARANLNPGLPGAINASFSGDAPVHIGLVGYLSGDVDGSYAGAASALDLDLSQPGYFNTLVAAHPELSLAQFGVYG